MRRRKTRTSTCPSRAPRIATSPPDGNSRAAMIVTSVVLPAPLGPSTAQCSRGAPSSRAVPAPAVRRAASRRRAHRERLGLAPTPLPTRPQLFRLPHPRRATARRVSRRAASRGLPARRRRRQERKAGAQRKGCMADLDPERLRERTEAAAHRWRPDASVGSIEELTGGSSSLTYTTTIRAGDDGERDVVLKLAPPGLAPVRNRDVLRQARLLRALEGADGVRVPTVLFDDAGDPPDEPPFFAM